MIEVLNARMRHLLLAKVALWMILTGALLWWQAPVTTFFGDIDGLDVDLFTQYAQLIELKGQPLAQEVIYTEDDGVGLRILHYDGISFYVGHSVAYFDITGTQYRLGGRHRIGVGSTRRQVEADFRLRARANFIADCSCSRIRTAHMASMSLPNAGFRYYQFFREVSFEFDENNRVIRMRISMYG